jgi:two-component system, OmpR family, response regulator
MAAPAGSSAAHLLVVDDEPEVRELLRRYFEGQQFRVTTVDGGGGLRAAISAGRVDLVLLDLGLPGEDGLALMHWLREHWRGPVVIVTGRGDTVDRVVGLELGADDYVAKPFDLRELLARVRSVLRRAGEPGMPAPVAVHEERVEFAGWTLDAGARTLRDPAGRDVPLTTGEFDLLRLFVASPQRVLSRDAIMNALHGRDAGPYDRAIDVQVGRLRRKIESDPDKPELLKSVRGAGYVLAAPVRRA